MNDEADLHLAAVTEAYEKEIDLILQDANAKVKKLAQAAEAGSSGKLQEQVQKIKASFEEEKQRGLQEVQTLRASASSREGKNSQAWTERMSKMSAEALALKQQVAQQAAQCRAALQASEEQRR
ncbi:unnamed protein product, partial [Prorocentrum cordatum]